MRHAAGYSGKPTHDNLPHLFSVDILVIWTVHHLVTVVLFQHLGVVAYALDVQVLPLVVKAVFLQSTIAVNSIVGSLVICELSVCCSSKSTCLPAFPCAPLLS